MIPAAFSLFLYLLLLLFLFSFCVFFFCYFRLLIMLFFKKIFYLIFFFMKIIFSCSGMFRNVPCPGFTNVRPFNRDFVFERVCFSCYACG